MTVFLVLFCLAIVGLSLLGGLLPLSTVLTHTRLQVYLSFSAGAMLGAVFFHMLPEAIEPDPTRAIHWTAVGLLTLFFLERFFSFHHHEAPADPENPCPQHPHSHTHGHGHSAGLVDDQAPGVGMSGVKGQGLVWGMAAFGLAIHTVIGGVALASASAAGTADGWPSAALWGVFLATVIHKPADALTIVSLMLRAGVPRKTAHLVNLGFSMMLPVGVLLFFGGLKLLGTEAAESFTALSLAFSAGTFLSIALSDLIPELQFHSHDRLKLSAALMAGFGLMVLTAFGE